MHPQLARSAFSACLSLAWSRQFVSASALQAARARRSSPLQAWPQKALPSSISVLMHAEASGIIELAPWPRPSGQQAPQRTVPSLQGPHFWDEAHSFQSYLDNFDGVAAAASADARAISGDASSNTFSYALVGLRRAGALLSPCFRREQLRTR